MFHIDRLNGKLVKNQRCPRNGKRLDQNILPLCHVHGKAFCSNMRKPGDRPDLILINYGGWLMGVVYV